jgi:hypothetical protein
MLEVGDKVIFPTDNKVNLWGCDFAYYKAPAPENILFTVDSILSNNRVMLRAPGYGEKGNYGNGAISVDLKDAEEYAFKETCEDCVDPVTNEIVEEICLTRRQTGICPQLPAIDKLKLKLNWLAEAVVLKMSVDEISCIDDPEIKDILLEAAVRKVQDDPRD